MDYIIVLYTYSNCLGGRKYKGNKETIADGGYEGWNDARIKGAFNFGNGTMNDFKRFCKANLLRQIQVDEFWKIVDTLPDAQNHKDFVNRTLATEW